MSSAGFYAPLKKVNYQRFPCMALAVLYFHRMKRLLFIAVLSFISVVNAQFTVKAHRYGSRHKKKEMTIILPAILINGTLVITILN